MAIIESTFSAIQFASNVKENAVSNAFRTGTPKQTDGTLALSSYHAYRSLAWFNGAAIASALVGERVLSISFTATSQGVSDESTEAVPVRLYRTDLHYDSTKIGWTDANTLRPDKGMTYDHPYNDHFIEYGETGELVKGSQITDSVFVTGDSATAFANALADGCALGTWNLKPGSSMSANTPPYMVRFMQDVSITIRHEPETTDVTPPTSVILLDEYASAGSEVRVSVSGATQPESGVNPITGYMVSMRTSEDGETWGNWSNDELVQTGATNIILRPIVSADDGDHIQLRVATTSAMNTTDYVVASGEVVITASPQIGSVLYKATGRRIDFSVRVPESVYSGNMYVYLDDKCVGMLTHDGGIARFSVLSETDGKYECDITVRDEYGGVSAEKHQEIFVTRNEIGKNWFMWKGLRSDDFGLLVTDFMDKSSATDRVENDRIIGRYGDVQNREQSNAFDSYDATFKCIALHGHEAEIRSWLTGDSELVMGDDPNEIYTASIQQAVEMTRYSHGISDKVIVVRVHVQPFRKHADDVWMPIARSGLSVLNDGDTACYPEIRLHGSGDLRLEIDNVEIIVQGVTNECVVDCYNRVAYGSDGNLLETGGEFPTLPVGVTEIVFSENVASAEIKRNRLYR